jgi:hypothetical protein
MSLNDKSVITAAVGYVYVAPAGTARPTPAQLSTIDPDTFGVASTSLKVTGAPTGGNVVITVGTGTGNTATVSFDADAATVQTELEKIASVGAGNVRVTGTGLLDAKGVNIVFLGKLAATPPTVTASKAGLTGGTTPDAVVTANAATGAGWSNIGHTSRGDMPEFGFDGGDTEVRGTWQNESLREVVTKPIADYLTMFLHQFDTHAFELYYGKNASKEAGVFGVASGTTTPIEKAIFILIVDGDTRVGFYSPKSSIRRDDSISLPVDEFAALPVRATFLKHGSQNKFEWVNQDLFV